MQSERACKLGGAETPASYRSAAEFRHSLGRIGGSVADMRWGMYSLALKSSSGLAATLHGGARVGFPGRKADIVKRLWFERTRVSLYARHLGGGKLPREFNRRLLHQP